MDWDGLIRHVQLGQVFVLWGQAGLHELEIAFISGRRPKEVVSFKLTDAEVGETPTEQNQQKMQGLQMRRNQGLVLSLLESTSPRKDQKSIETIVILRMWWDYTPHSFDCVFFKHFNLVFVVFGHSLWHRENLSPARGIRVSDGDRCSALFQRVSWPFKMPEWQGEHPPGLLFFFQHMNLDTLW